MAPPTISIHALLAESDRVQGGQFPGFCISIHALLAESDHRTSLIQYASSVFLSTLSLRRATTGTTSAKMPRWDFYPRSPCGERLQCHPPQPRPPFISIHALLAESDANSPAGPFAGRDFYPRSPCGERRANISLLDILLNFYPRSPCGERRH